MACPLLAVPKPEHGKAGQMVAREVARADQWACVCACVCVQYLKATLHCWTIAWSAHTGVGWWHQAATQ